MAENTTQQQQPAQERPHREPRGPRQERGNGDRPHRRPMNRGGQNRRSGERGERGNDHGSERGSERGSNARGDGKLLQVIPLGGLGEVGKNMTVIRYGDEIIIVDAGLMFPTEDMLGIDLVIPDISYLIENRHMVKAILLTHGHEDHIGALPYVMRELDVPVYGTPLTLGILKGRLAERGVGTHNLHPKQAGDQLQIGAFSIRLVRVNHSIPDAVALSIQTPIGTIFHTGDFKMDYTPVDGKMTDFKALSEIGNKGVLLMLADSTNAERSEPVPSESTVGVAFDRVFRRAKGRILVATFSSNVSRIQQIADSAVRYRRKLAILGRSMVNVSNIAMELGYLQIPEGTVVDIDEIDRYNDNQIVIVTTGSQGEPMSALTRMAMSSHRKVNIVPSDTVVISATPIPGNERYVGRTIDLLLKLGCDVVYGRSEGIHVSGHASQEGLKLMHNLIRPKYFMPAHGEYRMLVKHARLAQSLGMEPENIFINENGGILELTKNSAKLNGKVQSGIVLIDGLGVGDVGNIVLRDRQQLAREGVIIVVVAVNRQSGHIVSGPDFVSRGFVYVRESEELMDTAKRRVIQALKKSESDHVTEWSAIKTTIRDTLGRYIFDATRRRPIILPIIMDA
ncbi:RNase J family beta-CASP ribonuclease [Selenomonas sp. TAMA-11512]|uniref:ribonuclease J n=1 Tax=Selenomonas sp. TAMA-11512 TaxID=3095337 RepID=UPI0030D5D016